MTSPEPLLQRSLHAEEPRLAPPSTQTMFVTAFFGGPVAACAIAAFGSFRLRRLKRDAPILLGLLALTLAATVWLRLAPSGAPARVWLAETIGKSGFAAFNRAMALAVFVACFTLHRQAHRSTALLGLKQPNGWIVGLLSIVVGAAATVAVLAAVSLATGWKP